MMFSRTPLYAPLIPALFALTALAGMAAAVEEKVAPSRVTLRGGESVAGVVTLLNRTGNEVTLTGVPPDAPAKLPAGEQAFWPLVDALGRPLGLRPRLREALVELVPTEEGPRYVAYDGPFRAAITRRTLTAYDDPALDRLTLQVELACEPRMQPLMLKLPGPGVSWKWGDTGADATPSSAVASYPFNGEKSRTFELRLPRPDRGVARIDQLTLHGTVWVAPRRLDFDTELKEGATATRDGTRFTLEQVRELPATRTWEVLGSFSYPEGSMEWESHQAGLLGDVSLTLVSGDRAVPSVGRDVRTDESRRVEVRWYFRDVPGRPAAWRARVRAPSAPVSTPLRLEFRHVDLP